MNTTESSPSVPAGGSMFVELDSVESSYYKYKTTKGYTSKQLNDDKIEEKFQKKVIAGLPSAYRGQVEDEKNRMYDEYTKFMDWSIQVSDVLSLKRSLAVLTNTYMDLKYPFTKAQQERMVYKLFNIFNLYLSDPETLNVVVTFLIVLLLHGKKTMNISIHWRALYDLYKSTCRIQQTRTIVEENQKFKALLVKLIVVSRPYFKVSAFEEIHHEIQEYLVPHSNYLFFALNVLNLFLPTHHLVSVQTPDNSVPEQIQEYIAMWDWVDCLNYWDEKWTEIFMRLIKFGGHFNWKPFHTTIYTLVTRILDVAIGTPTMSHVKPVKFKVPEFYKLESQDKFKYTCMGVMLVYLINDQGESLDLMKSLISKISTYFHPSNQGEWSSDLAEFLLTLCNVIAKRYNFKPFNIKYLEEFVNIVYQPLLNTLYSKKKNFILSTCKVIKDLAYILPEMIFPKLIESFYSSFQSEEEVNRVISGIEIISTCLHPLMVSGERFPEGKTHIYNIMELTLSGLDGNYTNKASASFKLFYRLFTCVLLSDESQKPISTNANGEENENDRLITMSTLNHLDWSILFLESVLSFIQKVAVKQGDSKKRELPPGMFLNEILELYFSQMSDEIFDAVLERLLVYFTKTFEPDYYKQLGGFLMFSTFRDSKKSLNAFLPLIFGKLISKSGSILDLSDQEYRWYITLLGYVVFKGGYHLKDHKQLFIENFSILLASENKVIIKTTSKAIRKLVFSTTRYYPLNNRSLPDKFLATHSKENLTHYWGSTDKSIIFPVDWFEPKPEDIQFASELIDKFVKQPVEKLNLYIQSLQQESNAHSHGNGNGNGNGNHNGNGGSNGKPKYDKMKILNSLKLLNNILRVVCYIIPDAKPVPEHEYLGDNPNPFYYHYQAIPIIHGKVDIEQFSGLKEYIGQTIRQLITYIRSGSDEEVTILCASIKSLYYLFNLKKDIQCITTESVFNKWKTLKKMDTRNIHVFKAYSLHLDRQYQYYYSRPITTLLKEVLDDLLDLSVHTFREVRKNAQNTIKSLVSLFPTIISRTIVPKLITNILRQESDSEIKGSIYLLFYKSIFKKFKDSWLNQKTIVEITLRPLDQRFKPTTRELFFLFKRKLIESKYKPTLYFLKSYEMMGQTQPEGYYNIQVPQDLIEKSKNNINHRNAANFEAIQYVIHSIVNLLNEDKETVNWKEQIFILGSLIYYSTVVLDTIPVLGFKNINLELLFFNSEAIKSGFMIFIKSMTNDYPITRMLSLNIISQMLYYENPKYMEYCHEGYTGVPNTKFKERDNNIKLFSRTILSFIKPELQNLFSETYFEKLIKYQLLDHDTEGLNHTVSATLSTKALSEAWPNTRYHVTVQYFKVQNAKLFYGLLCTLGDSVFETFKIHIENLKTKTSKEEISLLSEFIGGIGRYIATGELELVYQGDQEKIQSRTNEMVTYISDVFLLIGGSYSNECIETWTTAVRFISHNLKFERLGWLVDVLYKLYQSSTNISILAKSIHFLRGVLYEVTWKSPEFHSKLLEIVVKEFANPYKQIRSEANRLLVRILNYQIIYPRDKATRRVLLEPPRLPDESVAILNKFKDQIQDSSDLSTEAKVSIKENLMGFISGSQTKGFSFLLPRILPDFIKPMISLIADPNKEIYEYAPLCCLAMAQAFIFSTPILDQILDSLDSTAKSSSWKVRKMVLPFLQIFFFNHSLYFTKNQIERCFALVIQLVHDPQVEVREISKTTLSSMFISTKDDQTRIQSLIDSSINKLNSLGKTSSENILEKHSCILILSAVVLSNPYQIPTYFPKVLDQLSRYSYSAPPLKGTVELAISEFWRTHKDSWEEEKLAFTEDEIEMMRSTKVSPSYYA